jgi:hypothetical protein
MEQTPEASIKFRQSSCNSLAREFRTLGGWGEGVVGAASRNGGGAEIKWRDGCSGSLSVSLTATHSANRHLV